MENPDNMDTQPMDLEPVFAACVTPTNNEKKQIFVSEDITGTKLAAQVAKPAPVDLEARPEVELKHDTSNHGLEIALAEPTQRLEPELHRDTYSRAEIASAEPTQRLETELHHDTSTGAEIASAEPQQRLETELHQDTSTNNEIASAEPQQRLETELHHDTSTNNGIASAEPQQRLETELHQDTSTNNEIASAEPQQRLETELHHDTSNNGPEIGSAERQRLEAELHHDTSTNGPEIASAEPQRLEAKLHHDTSGSHLKPQQGPVPAVATLGPVDLTTDSPPEPDHPGNAPVPPSVAGGGEVEELQSQDSDLFHDEAGSLSCVGFPLSLFLFESGCRWTSRACSRRIGRKPSPVKDPLAVEEDGGEAKAAGAQEDGGVVTRCSNDLLQRQAGAAKKTAQRRQPATRRETRGLQRSKPQRVRRSPGRVAKQRITKRLQLRKPQEPRPSQHKRRQNRSKQQKIPKKRLRDGTAHPVAPIGTSGWAFERFGSSTWRRRSTLQVSTRTSWDLMKSSIRLLSSL